MLDSSIFPCRVKLLVEGLSFDVQARQVECAWSGFAARQSYVGLRVRSFCPDRLYCLIELQIACG